MLSSLARDTANVSTANIVGDNNAYYQFNPLRFSYLNDRNTKWPKGENGIYQAGDYMNSYNLRGAKTGFPVAALSGGPGSALNSDYKLFFNPDDYHVVLSDWRGIGASKPKGPGPTNTTQGLLDDIATIQDKLGAEKITLQTNSWGSTMALYYAMTYPDRINGLVLGLPYLASNADIEWNYGVTGIAQTYPQSYADFCRPAGTTNAAEIVTSYAAQLQSDDPYVQKQALVGWTAWELARSGETSDLTVEEIDLIQEKYCYSLTRAAIMTDYTSNRYFIDKERGVLDMDGTLPDVPIIVLANDRDPLHRPDTLAIMREAIPNAEFVVQQDADWHWIFNPNNANGRTNDFIKNAYCYGVEKIRRMTMLDDPQLKLVL